MKMTIYSELSASKEGMAIGSIPVGDETQGYRLVCEA